MYEALIDKESQNTALLEECELKTSIFAESAFTSVSFVLQMTWSWNQISKAGNWKKEVAIAIHASALANQCRTHKVVFNALMETLVILKD